MAARAFAATLIVLIIGSSAAGWFRFVTAAGGTGAADAPALSAKVNAAIAKITSDAIAGRESASVRLTPAEVAWLIALRAASVRATRFDSTSTSEQVRGRAEARPGDLTELTEQSGASFNPNASNLLGASTSGSMDSVTAELAAVSTNQLAVVDGLAGDYPVVLDDAESAVPEGDIPFLVAVLLAAYFDRAGDGMALSGSTLEMAVGQRGIDSPRLIEGSRTGLGSTTEPGLAADALAQSSSRATEHSTMTESPSSYSAVGSGDTSALSGRVDQTHAHATAPRVLSAALAAIGLQRDDAASVSDAAFAMLGMSTTNGTRIAESPATAFTAEEIDAIHELAVAILAGAYVDASYLDSVVEAVSRVIAGDSFPLAEHLAVDHVAFTGATIGDATSGGIGGSYVDLQRLAEIAAAMLGSASANDRAALAMLVAGALRANDDASLDDRPRVLAGVGTGDAIGAIDLARLGVSMKAADVETLVEQFASAMAALDRPGIGEAAIALPGLRAPSDAALAAVLSARLALHGPSDEANLKLMVQTLQHRTEASDVGVADTFRILAAFAYGDVTTAIADGWRQTIMTGHIDSEAIAAALFMAITLVDQASLADAAAVAPGLGRPGMAEIWESIRAQTVVSPVSGPTLRAAVANAVAAFANPDGCVITQDWRQAVATGHMDSEAIAAALFMAIALADQASLADAAAASPGLGRHVMAELWESIWARTAASPLTGAMMRAAASTAAAHRENAAPLAIADLWTASVATGDSSSTVGPGSTERVFARIDASAIVALSLARILQRRAETPHVLATLEMRMARGPGSTPRIGTAAAMGLVRRGTEPLGVLVASFFSVRFSETERASVTEAVSFTPTSATNTRSPKTNTLETGAPDPGSQVAASPGTAMAVGETPPFNGDAPISAGKEVAPGTNPGDTQSVTIVPPPPGGSPSTRGEVVSVVWPTRPATLQVPEHGVTLNVPAGARSTVFQARVAVESPESLEVPPGGDVLRVVRIEIFDALGRPVVEPAPEKPMDLIIHLAARDMERLSVGKLNRQARSDLMKLQRFDSEAPEPVWRDIPVREVGDDAVVATLDHLSLFALVAKRGETDAPLIQEWSRRDGRRAPLVVIVAAAGIAVAVLVATQTTASLVRRRRRPQDDAASDVQTGQ